MEIKRIQNRLLEMAKITASILEQNNIPYELAYGSLLGAVRHNGFIPWDDDFDFLLFDDTYDKAMDVLRNRLPCDIFLENEKTEPAYFHDWAHIKDVNSICEYRQYPQDAVYLHKGLSIDLYKATKLKESEFAQFRYASAISYIDRIKKLGLISKKEYDERKILYAERRNKDKISSDRLMLAVPLNDGTHVYDDVFPLKPYKFEDTEFYGPNNADAVLRMIYGDYMVLPHESDRVSHYTSVKFIK